MRNRAVITRTPLSFIAAAGIAPSAARDDARSRGPARDGRSPRTVSVRRTLQVCPCVRGPFQREYRVWEPGAPLQRLSAFALRASARHLAIAAPAFVCAAMADGWGGWIRTTEYGIQSPAPYRLATPQRSPTKLSAISCQLSESYQIPIAQSEN